ncbi:uncharacterized protein LOC119746207 [Patiria miniata]|uniref:Major facilitator superfamily (MFS) profile domain-containing protein n=1 Tax=Patiria miniata TaxID=46514 RepID=A0A914BRL5_PATMI|nr:uncharacterized protein LOC119746207 [Patiria miniata]
MGLTLKTKKRLTNFAQSIFFLLGGIEYAVVLPTLNEYLGHLDGDPLFFGMVMAAFSFSGVLVSPLYGLIQDRIHKTKVLILFANLWEIGGNFLYFYGGSKYVLLGSRLLCGLGAGVGSAIFAQISRTSTERDRASALSVASAARQIGLLLGPALNLPLNICNFYIGPFHVNNFTGPGILMCILFIIMQVLIFFCFYDIPPLEEQTECENEDGKSDPVVVGSVQAQSDSCDPSSVCFQEGANRDIVNGGFYDSHTTDSSQGRCQRLNSGRAVCNAVQLSDETSTSSSDEKKTFSKLDVFLKEEVLVLLTAQFVFLFNQTCLETSVTVMTKRLLDFGGVENSILYAVAGFELLLSFVVIKCISKVVSDRAMIFGALTVEIVPYILLLVFYPHATPGRDKNLWWFATLFIVQVSGLGFLFIGLVSLFSKVTPGAMQGFAQGIRRAVGGIGTIMGPLWAGCIANWPFETIAVMLALFVLVMGMNVLSWKRLKPHSDITDSRQAPARDDLNEEAKPLLNINADETDYGLVD